MKFYHYNSAPVDQQSLSIKTPMGISSSCIQRTYHGENMIRGPEGEM